MEIIICQNCGHLLGSEDRTCLNCKTPVSIFAATAVPTLTNAAPMALKSEPVAVETTLRTGQIDFFSPNSETEKWQVSEKISLVEKNERAQSSTVKRPSNPADVRHTIKRFEQLLEPANKNPETPRFQLTNAPSFSPKTILIFAFCCIALVAVGFTFRTQATSFAEATPSPDLSGWYQITCSETPVEKTRWQLVLQQDGRHLFGQSLDNGASWKVDGEIIPPNTMRLEKKYFSHGLQIGFPIVYTGRFEINALGKPAMGGDFASRNKVFKLRPEVMGVRGNWWATYKSSTAIFKYEGTIASPPDSGQTEPATRSKTKKPNIIEVIFGRDSNLKSTELQNLFSQLAASLIGCGVLLALGALYIFGPYGKLNRMAKQEYIPSQYRSQHNKMMHEWSKPIKRGSVPLGNRTEWRLWKPWAPRVMSIPPEARRKNPHMLVIGGSDTGKTRTMANMICHDIESNDRAVVVIDSDGELTSIVTKWAAAHTKGKEIAKRIVVIDPTHRGGSMSYNPLEPLHNVNFIDAASAIVHGFKAIYTEPAGSQSQWNQQTANILRNAAILLMANDKTLVDLPTLLQDNDYRDILLEGVEKRKHERTEYLTLLETWGQYKKLARTDQWITWVEPILNRVTPMLSDPRIRPILTKSVGDLRLHDLIVNKQILLVRIPQGQLDQNANLLGSLIVTGLKQAALGLANFESDEQQPCALYLDEMNNFIEKETIEALTQESDKFQIGFVGCCKTLQHLPEDFRHQIIINVGTVLAFALAKKDGDMIGPQMFRVDGRKIKHRTIQNFFNQVNTSPQFELISDEEKLNIDRVVGQEERHFFCYRVGSVAGTFNLKTQDFADPAKAKVKAKLIEQMHRP